MKLRFRGSVHLDDFEWTSNRVPQQGELIRLTDGVGERWFRVANVIWAIDVEKNGWDVAVVLSMCGAPDQSPWVKKP